MVEVVVVSAVRDKVVVDAVLVAVSQVVDAVLVAVVCNMKTNADSKNHHIMYFLNYNSKSPIKIICYVCYNLVSRVQRVPKLLLIERYSTIVSTPNYLPTHSLAFQAAHVLCTNLMAD
jgi:hypothetical protein